MDMLIALFQSYRFRAAMIGVVVAVLAHYGIEIDAEKVMQIVTLILGSWIVSDGIRPTRRKDIE